MKCCSHAPAIRNSEDCPIFKSAVQSLVVCAVIHTYAHIHMGRVMCSLNYNIFLVVCEIVNFYLFIS